MTVELGTLKRGKFRQFSPSSATSSASRRLTSRHARVAGFWMST
jgi:hypothetical protein